MDKLLDYNFKFEESLKPKEEDKEVLPNQDYIDTSKITRLRKKPQRQIFDIPKDKKKY